MTGAPDGPAINGGNGADLLTGTNADERIDGGNGADTLSGGQGADTLIGGNGADSLDGGAGADSLSGDNGADILKGGAGSDVLSGGNGGDTFVFGAGSGHDIVTDFANSDQVQFDHTLFGNFAEVQAHAHQVGADVVISYDAANDLTLQGVSLSSLKASDFLFV